MNFIFMVAMMWWVQNSYCSGSQREWRERNWKCHTQATLESCCEVEGIFVALSDEESVSGIKEKKKKINFFFDLSFCIEKNSNRILNR